MPTILRWSATAKPLNFPINDVHIALCRRNDHQVGNIDVVRRVDHIGHRIGYVVAGQGAESLVRLLRALCIPSIAHQAEFRFRVTWINERNSNRRAGKVDVHAFIEGAHRMFGCRVDVTAWRNRVCRGTANVHNVPVSVLQHDVHTVF